MFVVFVVAFLVLGIIFLKFQLTYWRRRGVPGPKPWPFFGNTASYFMGKRSLGNIMREFYKKYEGYPFVGVFRGTQPMLIIRDPDFVNHVLVKDFKAFRNNEFIVDKKTDPLFGHNPFVMKDQEWKGTRQMLTPGTTSGKMKIMFPNMSKILESFVKFVENHPTASTDGIETRALTKRLTLDNVAKAAFGIDGKSFDSYDDISEFNKLADQFLSRGNWIIFLGHIFPFLSKLCNLKFVARDVENQMIEIVSEVVKYRRDNNAAGSDYLQFLIELAKDKKLSDAEITSHASTFFIDGYETTSLVLSNFLLNMALNPEYQEKVREDIRKYEGENNGKLTYEAVHEMPWLNACFYESFRAMPPMDILVKRCTESFEYTPEKPDFKPITIKLAPGDMVVVPYGLLPTDDKYFENADKFIPERMFKKEAFAKSIFFPFSEGPRSCIGQRFGIMSVKLAAACILKNFNVSVSPKLKLPITFIPYHFMKEVEGGIWLKYQKI